MNGHPTDSVRTAGRRLAWLCCLGVALLLGWWVWRQGAYFDQTFYPGAIGLILLSAALLLFSPFQGGLRGPALATLASLALLAAWTGLSGLWSEVPSAAPPYAARVFSYTAIFLLGLWVVLLLRERMTDVLLAIAGIGLAVGVATLVVISTGHDSDWYVHIDATLRFPIGYRNANAALFMACLWPMMALAADNARHWAIRVLAVGGATLMIELTILAQSRGSVPATLLALIVFIAVMPYRLRAASVVALAALPAALALPVLLEVFRYGNDDAGVLVPLQDAARVAGLTTLLSMALATAVFLVVYPRLHLGARRVELISRALAATALIALLVGAFAFVARDGGPVEFIDQRVDEFTSIGSPDLSSQGVRYGANVGSNRGDFWRVSLKIWRDSPIIGAGAGGFETGYLRERRSHESPQDPHSAEMLMLSEQGLIGVTLFLAFLIAAVWAALRSRRLGAKAALLSAAALAAGVQWLLPASYDWFWQYAGVTAPVIFLLGAAAAPALIDPGGRLSRSARTGGALVCVALVLAMVPFYLADRYISRGQESRANDPASAVADFERAADLSPWDSEPLRAAAQTELETGDDQRAIAFARAAVARQPTDFAANTILAQALIEADHPGALAQVARLRQLSPLAPEIRLLRRQAIRNPGETRLDSRQRDR